MTSEASCPLCRRIAELDRSPGPNLVWKFPHSTATLGPWQFYTGYCVLVSRDHATELSQLGANRAAFLEEMSTLAAAIEACFHPHKLNYELLGNLVPHLHWHLFPRSADDPDRLRPVWFATERAERDAAEKARLERGSVPRDETAARLRGWLIANGAPRAPEM
ncbi:MAG TPA: HIT family protein [Gemmata sp.]|nr:HIT family protein [Gemmata sp.]